MIHKIVHISEIDCSSWPEFQGQGQQWQSSRYALCQALRQLEPDMALQGPERLEIEGHHCLKHNPQILVGLSHSGDYGAAVVGWRSPSLKGLGIDIEREGRPVPEGGEKFFIRDEDDVALKAHSLRLWVAKEAAFKAFFPLYRGDKTLVLHDFWVRGPSFGLGRERLGHLEFIPRQDGLCVAMARVE